jgi:parvulin-like peptidyl-prolyl isomerase
MTSCGSLWINRVVLFLASGVLFLSLAGCDQIGKIINPRKAPVSVNTGIQAPVIKVKGTVIAKVNNIPVTLEDLNEEIAAYNDMVPQDKPELKITTREKKIDYLKNELVRRALLYQEALNRKLDLKDEIIGALEKARQNLLVMELVRTDAEKVEVTSKDIEDYYNSYKEEFRSPEERQIREIVVASEQEAKDILIQLLQGADFAALAKERSKSASASNGGDLGFIQKGQKAAQFDAVAFSDTLEAGKNSSIFKIPEGYSIIKLEAKRGGQQVSLSDTWDRIKQGLTFLKQQQKIEELVSRLSTQEKIEIYEGEIK